MKKADLKKAADELNILIFDPEKKESGWIDGSVPTAELKTQIKDAALWLYDSDELTDKTAETLKGLDWTEEDFATLKADQDPLPLFKQHGIYPQEENTPVEVSESRDSELSPQNDTEVPLEAENADMAPETESEEYLDRVPPKLPASVTPSAYGTALALMGPNPDISYKDLLTAMTERGFDVQDKAGTIKTARSIFRKCHRYLRENGHCK